MSFISGEDSTTQICGFTIQNGKGTLVNSVQRFGGGIYCYDSSRPTISNCIISNNSADAGSGGGISCWYASAIIENCIIRNNSNHGIANMFGLGVKVVNCLIHDNYGSDYGGGIKAGGGSIPVLINCTITNNDSYHHIGSGIYAISGVNVVNSIVWNNVGTNLNLEESATSITYSCIEGGHAGARNKENDPLFVDANNSNYQLSDSSHCIGSGITDNAPSVDLAANPRPAPTGTNPDMGAYENMLAIPEGLIIEIRNLEVASGQDPLHHIDHTPVISFSFYNNADGDLSSYQLQVSSYIDFANIDKWDTSVIESSDTSIVYNGNALEDGYTYYLRVKGHSSEVWDQWSVWDTVSFRMNSLPLAPTLLYPTNDIVLSDNFMLRLHQSSDPESDILEYEYFLYEDSSLVNVIDSSGAQTDTSWTIEIELTDNDQYWWTARSFDGYEFGVFSEKESFYVNTENSSPDSFDLIYPLADSQISTQSPTLSWQSAFDFDPGDIVTYTLYLDTPEPGIIEYNTSTDTLYLLNDLTDNTTYYWKVIASDSSGATRENTEGYQSFTVNAGNENPTVPLVSSPDSVIVLTLKPEFRWEASTDPDLDDSITYKMYIWNDTLNDSSKTGSNRHILTDPLLDNTGYSWYVKALDDYAGYSISQTAQFWTDLFPEPPAPFTTISPINGEVFESTLVDLIWNSSKDPDPLDYSTYTLKYKSTHQDSNIWKEVEVGIDTAYSLNLTLGNRYEWQIIAKDDDGFEVISDSSNLKTFDVGEITGIAFLDIPQEFILNQNYPNPFNPTTTLEYGLPETSDITLRIFSITGHRIKEWTLSNQLAGWHNVIWDGKDINGNMVSTGVYIYSLQTGNFVNTRKMLFMK